MSKIFIIGLPRTGTTSVCVSLLDSGLKVAHCAVTEGSLLAADAIGDTPAYNDYKMLDKRFPGSRFIYLERQMDSWLPSIKSLLANMVTGLNSSQGGFPPAVKRCYRDIFQPLTATSITSDAHLSACYTRHKNDIYNYFNSRDDSFLAIDISQDGAYRQMVSFLDLHSNDTTFKKMNTQGQIISWRELQHINKIRLNLPEPDGRLKFL